MPSPPPSKPTGATVAPPAAAIEDTIVFVSDDPAGQRQTVTLREGPSNPEAGVLGLDTPLARALLGVRAGQTVEVRLPRRVERIRVIEVQPAAHRPRGRSRAASVEGRRRPTVAIRPGFVQEEFIPAPGPFYEADAPEKPGAGCSTGRRRP